MRNYITFWFAWAQIQNYDDVPQPAGDPYFICAVGSSEKSGNELLESQIFLFQSQLPPGSSLQVIDREIQEWFWELSRDNLLFFLRNIFFASSNPFSGTYMLEFITGHQGGYGLVRDFLVTESPRKTWSHGR